MVPRYFIWSDRFTTRLILHVLFSGCFEPGRHISLLFLNLFLTLLLKPSLKMFLLIIHIMETDHWSHSVSLFPVYIRAPWVSSILIFLKDVLLARLWVGLSCAAALAGPVTGKNIDDRDMVWNLLLFMAAGLDVVVAVRFDCCFISACMKQVSKKCLLTSMKGNLEITSIKTNRL